MADYIIIGGGSAGCVLCGPAERGPDGTGDTARSRSARQQRVDPLPCRTGPAGQERQANWAFQTVPQPGQTRPARLPAAWQGAGGSSLVNAMIYARAWPPA